MKELFRSCDTGRIGLYQSILDDAEIPHFVRNYAIQQEIVGGLLAAFVPLPDFWPTLCALNDDDYPEAMSILLAVRDAPPPLPAETKCPRCAETAPGNFTTCWNCESPLSPELPGES